MNDSPEPFRFFRDVRRVVISLLQNRSYPIWKRLFMLGCLCEKLDEMGARGRDQNAANVREYVDSLNNGMLDNLVANCAAHPAAQLEVVLELIVVTNTFLAFTIKDLNHFLYLFFFTILILLLISIGMSGQSLAVWRVVTILIGAWIVLVITFLSQLPFFKIS